MKKSLLLCLTFIFSYNVHSSEQVCSKDMVSSNAFNNFILIQEQSFNDDIKKVYMHIESKDDYINNNSHVEFDDCGALLKLRNNRIIKTRNKNHVLVVQVNTVMDKNDVNWDYNMTFKMHTLEQGGSAKNLMIQEMKGKFLTGSDGKINKAEDTSNIFVGNNHEFGRSVTEFLIDDKGRLSESKRVSTLKNDNVNTVYNYDSQNRLIQTSSGSTTEEFTYGNDNRELSSKKVQKFFTTETTTTTCNNWNKFGRCTNAKQNISILINGNKGDGAHIYKHLADVKYTYVY
ncbi:Uncharacterised protein [Yersinia rohdei]|uniref:Uncharacterized protein n=1 Tax=Yersinia rohdei TaxID=29485 RepID=A0A0U1HU68_YERRO|nr:hypothetical protein [Yersinia rohdei]CQI91461.1 Uncharacterised protein [Yersinia rohdei]